MEALQLSTRERLEPALALYLIIAWRIQYLTVLGRTTPDLPCDAVLDPAEWRAVYVAIHRRPPAGHPAAAAGHARLDRPPGWPFGPQVRWTTRPPSPLDRLAARPRPRLGYAIGL